jgi:hypothetical protein
MAYLVMFHWGWLLGALLLGFAMGWIAVVHRGPGVSRAQAGWLGLLAAALVVAVLTHIVPGRPGYWLELALVMLGPYVAGCAIGSLLRAWVVRRSIAPRSG